jgi:hypothetical protein
VQAPPAKKSGTFSVTAGKSTHLQRKFFPFLVKYQPLASSRSWLSFRVWDGIFRLERRSPTRRVARAEAPATSDTLRADPRDHVVPGGIFRHIPEWYPSGRTHYRWGTRKRRPQFAKPHFRPVLCAEKKIYPVPGGPRRSQAVPGEGMRFGEWRPGTLRQQLQCGRKQGHHKDLLDANQQVDCGRCSVRYLGDKSPPKRMSTGEKHLHGDRPEYLSACNRLTRFRPPAQP